MSENKIGFWTATSVVVGSVVGSGVFFKADNILEAVNGNVIVALFAWFAVAFAMIFGSLVFANLAKTSSEPGLVGYVEECYGEKAGYATGWLMAILYYPALTAVLAWISANYTITLFGGTPSEVSDLNITLLSFAIMTGIFAMNAFAGKIANAFAVASVGIKLVPLVFIAIFGMIVGIANGTTVADFSAATSTMAEGFGGFGSALLAVAFAYEGWIGVTALARQMDDESTLPKALIVGSVVILVVYVTYFLGVTGSIGVDAAISNGDDAAKAAATKLFGSFLGSGLTAFVLVSCLGTCNANCMGAGRAMQNVALKGNGIAVEACCNEKEDGYSIGSGLVGYAFSTLALIFIITGYVMELHPIAVDEFFLPVLYAIYIAVYIKVMITNDEGAAQKFVFPILATIGASVLVVSFFISGQVLIKTAILAVILLASIPFYKGK